jgi:hypothetical protein
MGPPEVAFVAARVRIDLDPLQPRLLCPTLAGRCGQVEHRTLVYNIQSRKRRHGKR